MLLGRCRKSSISYLIYYPPATAPRIESLFCVVAILAAFFSRYLSVQSHLPLLSGGNKRSSMQIPPPSFTLSLRYWQPTLAIVFPSLSAAPSSLKRSSISRAWASWVSLRLSRVTMTLSWASSPAPVSCKWLATYSPTSALLMLIHALNLIKGKILK